MKPIKPTCWLRPNGKTVASRKKALKLAKRGEEMVPMVPFSKARKALNKMEQELCDHGDYQQSQQVIIHDLHDRLAFLRGLLASASYAMDNALSDVIRDGEEPQYSSVDKLQTVAKNINEYLKSQNVLSDMAPEREESDAEPLVC